jgi:hypothetical protein
MDAGTPQHQRPSAAEAVAQMAEDLEIVRSTGLSPFNLYRLPPVQRALLRASHQMMCRDAGHG